MLRRSASGCFLRWSCIRVDSNKLQIWPDPVETDFLDTCRSLGLMRSSLKQLSRCSGCSGDAAILKLCCRSFRCAAQHISATAVQILHCMPQTQWTHEPLAAAYKQLDAALQVASNVAQSQAALQLLVPQGDYAAALDVMDDIRVRSQASQCLALMCAGMQGCSAKGMYWHAAFQGMYWHAARQQPSAAQDILLPAVWHQPGLSWVPAWQYLPQVLLDGR